MIIGIKNHISKPRLGSKLNLLPPEILSDGNTLAWYNDENVEVSGDNVMSAIDISENSRNLASADTSEPIKLADGVEFDGVNDYLRSEAFVIAQPFTVYCVFAQKSWTDNEMIYDGRDSNECTLYQRTVKNGIKAYAGLPSVAYVCPLNSFIIARVVYNGTSSKYIIDENTPWTGNLSTKSLSGITLGAGGNIAFGWSNYKFREAIFRSGVDNETDELEIYDWLKKKYKIKNEYLDVSNIDAFSYESSPDVYAEKFDQLRLLDTNYISKTVIGQSSIGTYDISRWDFTPTSPTKKVLVVSGIHASEKVYGEALIEAFDYFFKNYGSSSVMKAVKERVHIVVVPLVNVSSFPNNSGLGFRPALESKSNITWSRVGTVATITIDPVFFNVLNNPNISASNYISADYVNKGFVYFDNTSDGDAIPNGSNYIVKSVIDQYSFTIEVLDQGATSGTADLKVYTDINRNFGTTSPAWADYVSPNWQFNKGTKPFSLNESALLKNIIESESPDLILDFHNGSSYYDVWSNSAEERTAVNQVWAEESKRTARSFTHTDNNAVMTLPQYAFANHNIPSFGIEWGTADTSDDATAATRWALNLIMRLGWLL